MSPAARREQFIVLGRDLIKRVSLDRVSIESVAQAAGVVDLTIRGNAAEPASIASE